MDVLKSLTGIILTSNKLGERNMANKFLKKMEFFQFIIVLCLLERILWPLRGVSKLLQQRNMDLHNARDRLVESFSRNYYINIIKYANDLCTKWYITINGLKTIQRLAKKLFDEMEGDRRLNITQNNFFPLLILYWCSLN